MIVLTGWNSINEIRGRLGQWPHRQRRFDVESEVLVMDTVLTLVAEERLDQLLEGDDLALTRLVDRRQVPHHRVRLA